MRQLMGKLLECWKLFNVSVSDSICHELLMLYLNVIHKYVASSLKILAYKSMVCLHLPKYINNKNHKLQYNYSNTLELATMLHLVYNCIIKMKCGSISPIKVII